MVNFQYVSRKRELNNKSLLLSDAERLLPRTVSLTIPTDTRAAFAFVIKS